MVAILLRLQQRGHVTAAELEVSDRVDGLPVYSLRGRNGVWRTAYS